jgi:sugar-specific transcriptional regulator TrmB
MSDQTPTPDIQTIAAEIKREFSDKHDRLLSELQTFTTDSSAREQETLKEVQHIHTAIVNMIEDAREAALDRNEVIVKTTKRTARVSDRSAKIVGGTGLLLVITIIMVVYSDPRDVADTLRRFLPAVGAAWIGLIGYLLYDKKPELKEDEPTRGDPTSP